MTIRQWATELGVSRGTVTNLLREGMPTEPDAAKRWLELRNLNKRRGRFLSQVPVDLAETSPDDLEDSCARIRRLEKALGLAALRAFKADQIPEAISLRREHAAALKALYDAELKLIKINEARGKLIRVDRALGMITDALQPAIMVLRQLPELGRDQDERRRLEGFMNGVLAEMKRGAADGFDRAG